MVASIFINIQRRSFINHYLIEIGSKPMKFISLRALDLLYILHLHLLLNISQEMV